MFRKFVVGVLSFVFIVLFFSVSLIFGVFNTFLDSDFYDDEFSELAYDFSLDQIVENANLADINSFDKDDLRSVLENSFDKDDLSIVVDSFVDQIENSVTNDESVIEFYIPLGWVGDKSELIADSVADKLYEVLDVCEPGDENFSEDLSCIPDALTKEEYKDQVRSSLSSEILEDVPNEIEFAINMPSGHEGSVSDFVSDFVNDVFLWCLLGLLFILLLLALVVFKPWTKILKVELRTIFVASFFTLFTFGALFLLMDRFADNEYFYIASFLIGALFGNLMNYLLPILILSLGLWFFVSFISKKKNIDES